MVRAGTRNRLHPSPVTPLRRVRSARATPRDRQRIRERWNKRQVGVSGPRATVQLGLHRGGGGLAVAEPQDQKLGSGASPEPGTIIKAVFGGHGRSPFV